MINIILFINEDGSYKLASDAPTMLTIINNSRTDCVRTNEVSCNGVMDETGDDMWGSDEKHSRGDWMQEAGMGDTQLGYWDWVSHKREEDKEEEEQFNENFREPDDSCPFESLVNIAEHDDSYLNEEVVND